MADAKKTAPLQRESTGIFLPEYKFDTNKKYGFVAVEKNPQRELPVIDQSTGRPYPTQDYKPSQNIVLSSQIVWEGQRRNLRYYDGCTTLFVDEQPQQKELVEQLVGQSKPRAFTFGKFSCDGDERMLLIYLSICSWNAESSFRTKTASQIFIGLDTVKVATATSEKLDLLEKALGLAREATDTKMRIHGGYLGISMVDADLGNDLTEKEIRSEYRKQASAEPKMFIESYGNKAIETKYFLDQAWEKGQITNKNNPNKAAWASGTEICDISGLISQEAIVDRLYEFTQKEEGEEFKIQLNSIFS